jgi:fibronectin-binding autotransporter adhesin
MVVDPLKPPLSLTLTPFGQATKTLYFQYLTLIMKSQKSPRGLRVSPVSVSLLAAAMATLSPGLRAELVEKENNTTALDLPASWTNGVVPTSADIATYSSLNTASSTPVTIGAGMSLAGMAFVSNPGTNMTINAGTGGTLVLGASGIDVSAAGAGTRNLVIGSSINLSANQTWKTGIATANTSQISANGVISGPGGLNIVGDSGGTNQNVLLNSASNTFSGGVTLNAGGGLRVAGTPVVASGVITSSCLGTGPLVVNGGTFFSTGGSIVSNATVNGDFSVNIGQGATGSTHGNNGRFTIAGGTWNLGGAVRNVTLGRFNKLQGTNNVLTSGFESMRLLLQGTGATAAPAISIQNGTLRFIRDNFATPTAPTETDYSSVVFGTGALFANGAGFTVGDHVVTVFATGNPFGTTAGAQPIVGVEPNGYFNLADAGNSRSPQIRGLTGTGGTVTNLSNSATVATSTLTITPIANDSFTFPGKIVNGASEAATTGLSSQNAIIAVTKSGAGTQILTGANSYTGNTTVNAGKLVTTTASNHGVGAYTVANSATLGVRVHQAGSSLGLTNLTLGASTVELDLLTNGNPTAPLINNAGTLTLNGATVVNVIGSSGTLTPGTYTLVSSAGRSGAGAFNLGSLPVGVTATLAESGNNLNLVISNVNLSYQWTGATNATWNTDGANLNWTLGGANSAYSDATARDVLFDDNATGSTAIDLTSLVTPNSTTVASSSLAYSISGTGGIGGTGSLSKSGSSVLTLATTNTYSGGTTVTEGTLNVTGGLADSGAVTVNGGTATYTVGANDTVGALTLTSGTINGSATLSPASVDIVTGTISASLAGSANVTKTGTGNVSLSGASSYTGVTTVSAGTLTLGHAQALGSSAGGTVLATNTSLILADGLSVSGEPISISGLGNGSRGVIRVASGSATFGGEVVIDNSGGTEARLGGSVAAGGTLTLSGVISGGSSSLPAGTVAAAMRSNSVTDTVVLSGASTFAGDLGLWAGQLRLAGGDNRLPVTARLITASFISGQPNKLDLNGTNQQLAGLLDQDAGGLTGSLTTITNESVTASVLTVANADTNEFTGPVTGNLSLVKSGAGSLTLSGTHAYTGGTTVNAGTLAFAQTGLADSADVRINGGILALNFGGTDTVNALHVNGVLQPAGVYGATGSGAASINDSLFSGPGTLTVTTGAASDPYAAWAAGYNFNGGDSTVSGDPDNDGFNNLLEWVLAGDPTISDAAATGVSVVKDATYLNLVFDRSDSSESAVTLVARWGTDLSNWTNVTVGAASAAADANGVIVTVVENGAAADNVTVSIPLARASGGRLFGTLRATKN